MNASTSISPGAAKLGGLASFAFLLGIVPQAMTEAAITASLPEIARDLGSNGEFAAQMLMLTGMLGLVFGALFSGKVLEWLGAKRTYVGSAVLFAIAGCAGFYVRQTELLFVSRILTGFAASCIATTAMWGVAAQFKRDARPKSFGYAGAIGGTLAIASVVIGGYLTQHFGWRAAFVQFAIVGLVLLPIAVGGVAQVKPEGVRSGHPGHFRRLLPLYIQNFLLYAVIGVMSVQLPFLLNDAGLTDAGARSLIQAIPGTGVIIGGALFGMFAHRLGSRMTFGLTIVSILLGFLTVAVNQSVPALAIGAAGTGLCMGLSMPWFYNSISEQTPPEVVGRYMGYLGAFTFIGAFTNPFWAEPIKSVAGPGILFLVGAVIAAIIFIYAMLTGKREAKP